MAGTGLTSTQMVDMVLVTLAQYPPDKSFEYLFDSDIHTFELLNRAFQKQRMMVEGGKTINRFVNYRETGTAEFVQAAQTYQPTISATLVELNIGWRHGHGHFSLIRDELQNCRSTQQLIDLIAERRQVTQMDIALLIEKQFLAAPSSADDDTHPYSLPYYIKVFASGQTAAGDFQGQHATGFSDCAGIDASTYTRWRNWNAEWPNTTGEYTDVAEDRLGRMFRHLNFEAPFLVTDLAKPRFENKRIYTNETTLMDMERKAKQQNDQVGADLAKYQGATLFKGLPLIWLKPLDTYDATRGYFPVYMVNWGYLKVVIREGDFFRTDTFGPDKYQPDTTTTHVDVSYNLLCTNRQCVGGVISSLG